MSIRYKKVRGTGIYSNLLLCFNKFYKLALYVGRDSYNQEKFLANLERRGKTAIFLFRKDT